MRESKPDKLLCWTRMLLGPPAVSNAFAMRCVVSVGACVYTMPASLRSAAVVLLLSRVKGGHVAFTRFTASLSRSGICLLVRSGACSATGIRSLGIGRADCGSISALARYAVRGAGSVVVEGRTVDALAAQCRVAHGVYGRHGRVAGRTFIRSGVCCRWRYGDSGHLRARSREARRIRGATGSLSQRQETRRHLQPTSLTGLQSFDDVAADRCRDDGDQIISRWTP